MEVDEDGQVVRVEACGWLPQGGEDKVGTTKGKIGRGREAGGGKAGVGFSIEEAKGPAIRCRDDKLTPRERPIVRGRGVPRLVVSVKVAYDQRITSVF